MLRIHKILERLDKYLDEFFLVIFLILICAVMFLQIIMRFVFRSPLTWPEEFCRYCFVVSAMLATAYCIRKGKMLRIDTVINLFPAKAAFVLDIFSSVLTLVFCCIMIRPAYTVTAGAFRISQVSPAMEIPVWILYISAPIGFVLGAFRSVQSIWRKIKSGKEAQI